MILCYGIYELQEGESPEDFLNIPCQCSGNLVHIQDMDELEELKKKCPICGHINSFNSQRCDNCGRCFDVGLDYLDSPLNDIEITPKVLRIYNKEDEKLTDVYQYDLDKIRDFSILREKSMHKIRFNYENSTIIIEITYKQATNLEKILEISPEIFTCPNPKCSFNKLLDETEECPKCGKLSINIDSDSYNRLKQAKLRDNVNKPENKSNMQIKPPNKKIDKEKEAFSLRKTIRFDKFEEMMEKNQKKQLAMDKGEYEKRSKEGLISFAHGISGQLELYEHKIIIRRKGKMAFFAHGWKGDKEIFVNQISSIQLKKTDDLTSGYIQFAFLGGTESKRGLFQAGIDENTITFYKFQEPDFIKIKDLIEAKMLKHQGFNKTEPEKNSFNDLEKLAELKDKGIITEEEFEAKKKQILEL